MKSAIVQFNIDPSIYNNHNKLTSINKTNEEIYNLSSKCFDLYCKKYKIDHFIITEPKIYYEHPTWERLDLWFNKTWLEKYDKICYVDTDVFPMPWAQDIFTYLDLESFCRIPYEKGKQKFKEDSIFYSCPIERVQNCYIQTGVILLNKVTIEQTMKTMLRYKEPMFTDDGALFNYATINSNLSVKNIPENFNVKYVPEADLSKIQFLHAFGRYKDFMPKEIINTINSIYK